VQAVFAFVGSFWHPILKADSYIFLPIFKTHLLLIVSERISQDMASVMLASTKHHVKFGPAPPRLIAAEVVEVTFFIMISTSGGLWMIP